MPEKEKTIDIEIGSDEETTLSELNPASDVDASDEETLSDRLYRQKEHSINGQAVEGRVVDIESGEHWVRFHVERMTDDKVIKDTFKIPEPWNENSRLASVLDAYGYGPSTIEMFEGETVQVRPHITGWRIIDPEAAKKKRRRRLMYFAGTATMFGGLMAYAILTGNILLAVLLTIFFLFPFIFVFTIFLVIVTKIRSVIKP